MSYVPHHDRFSGFTPSSFINSLFSAIRAGLVEGLKRLIQAVSNWRTRQINYSMTKELLEMDDAMLRDIGLTSGDVRLVLRDADVDPTLRLNRIATARRQVPNHLIR